MIITALKQVSEHGGPMVLGAGMTLFAVALVTHASHGGITAAPPARRPATTAPAATPTPTGTPQPRTTATHPTAPIGGQVLATDAPRSDTSGHRRPGSGAPSGPTPHPTTTPQTHCNVSVTSAVLAACLKLGIRNG